MNLDFRPADEIFAEALERIEPLEPLHLWRAPSWAEIAAAEKAQRGK